MTDNFRILDLGSHDGFVTHFIARKAKEAGRTLHVDGIEANKHGVALFNKRAVEQGIPGKCEHGLAGDATTLFHGEKYDAVIAFELLEHVANVDDFLDTVEPMCTATGRIYVSTPNGTFGAGNNPHHLHCWTIMELFDILRKRGHVHDAMPGPDGVSVISYTPFSRRDIQRPVVGIYCGPGWEQWAPSDIEHKGLGGSETAAVRLANALATYDAHVTVYGEVSVGAVGQVVYKHHSAFDPQDFRDLLIVSRIPEVYDRRVNAVRSLLWMHDTDAMDRLTPYRAEQVDRVMCLSQWHHDHLAAMYPFIKDKLYITRNGIDPSYFQRPEGMGRLPHRAVYTSSPDRGLDLLLEWWPEIRRRVPDAELRYAYASVYDAVAARDPRIRAFRVELDRLSEQPGVTNLGALTQPQVAQEMMQAGVWLAPSFSTPGGVQFNETFCIGAVEAAAAGCRRVMSQWGALTERDETGYPESRWVPVSVDGSGLPQQAEFIDAVVKAMTMESDYYEPSREALRMDWDEVAADFLAAAVQPVG